jgi:hypothetical protein
MTGTCKHFEINAFYHQRRASGVRKSAFTGSISQLKPNFLKYPGSSDQRDRIVW